MMSEMDVNAIAGTLKLYFHSCPSPSSPTSSTPTSLRAQEHWASPVPFPSAFGEGETRVSAQTLRVVGDREPSLGGLRWLTSALVP